LGGNHEQHIDQQHIDPQHIDPQHIELIVFTRDQNGAGADRGFHLLVTC
jgi:hypothetical protein